MTNLAKKKNFNSFLGKSVSLLLILTVLLNGEEHTGYSLITKVKELTQGKISLLAGTIYPQLEKLETDNLIEKIILNESSRSKEIIRQKAVYKINTNGIKYVQKLWEDWEMYNVIIERLKRNHV